MLEYTPAPFSQGRMDFAWEELTDEERAQAYADWQAGRGLIGGDPRLRPGSHLLPPWGVDKPFFRTLALDDDRGKNGALLRESLAGDAPLEVEIGFGRGDFLWDRASRYPERLFIGYETKIKATRLFLDRIVRSETGNLWISDDDARFSLPRTLVLGRAAIIHILFPDPWWKSQHLARRLFTPPFVDLLADLIAPGGMLHFKSDVQEYGTLVQYLVESNANFSAHDPALAERIGDHAPTHREMWCRRNQKPVWAYYFARQNPIASFQDDSATPFGQ